MYQNTGVNQLCSYRTADLRLSSQLYMKKKNTHFSYDAHHIIFQNLKDSINDTIRKFL